MLVRLERNFRGEGGVLQAELSVVRIVLRRRMRVMVLCIQPGFGRMQVQGMRNAFDLRGMQMAGMAMRRHLPAVAVGRFWMEMVKREQEKVKPQKENKGQQKSRQFF